jgi:hypothetical protein
MCGAVKKGDGPAQGPGKAGGGVDGAPHYQTKSRLFCLSAGAVTADPHEPTDFMPGDFEAVVALAPSGVQQRSDYVASWLQCKLTRQGPDADGDGLIWCNDCNDDDPSVHSGAPEICGNQIDDNCNGVVDEGCPATTTGP